MHSVLSARILLHLRQSMARKNSSTGGIILSDIESVMVFETRDAIGSVQAPEHQDEYDVLPPSAPDRNWFGEDDYVTTEQRGPAAEIK